MMNDKENSSCNAEFSTPHSEFSIRIPAIRFKGFNGAWDKKILGELVKLENGFAFKSKYFKTDPTDVIVLTPGSVNIGGGFQDGKGQYYDVKQDIPDKYVFKSGDIFITMTDLTPTAQALGFPAIVPKDGNTYLHNQRLGKLVGFAGDSKFLFNLLSTPKKQKEVVLTSSGTTVKHTSSIKFLNRNCYLPKKEEQTKIGHYFQQLDTLIARHQQKHDKLLSLKKALLEKMFPKQGASLPEIRFKGFSGDWVKNCLSDLCEETYGGGTPRTSISNYWDGETPWIQSSDLSEDQVMNVTPRKSISKNGLRNSATKLIPEESIAIVTRVGVGKISLMQKEYATSQDFLSLSKLKVAPLYGVYSIWKMLQIEKLAVQGTSIKGITKVELLSKVIDVPMSGMEQTKIGNLFQQLDTLLNQHQAQLKKLNNIKQACLEKMFV